MASINIKQRVLEAVQRLPPDATVEDAIEHALGQGDERGGCICRHPGHGPKPSSNWPRRRCWHT